MVAVVLVALDDHEIPVEDRRRARAQSERGEGGHRLPGEVTLCVVGVEALGTEIGVDHRAVGYWRRPGETAPAVAGVEDRPFVGRAIPEDLAGRGVECHDLERMLLVGGDAVGVNPVLFLSLTVLDGPLTRDDVAFDDGGEVDAVAPDNRGGHPCPRKLSLPHDVLVRSPFGGYLSVRRYALPAGPAPLGPVLGCRRRDRSSQNGHGEQQALQCTNVTHRMAPTTRGSVKRNEGQAT